MTSAASSNGPSGSNGSGPRFSTISFLSDFGAGDETVGVLRSVVRSLAPDVAVIDITHEIDAHDVRAGGLTLARSVQYLAPGVVLGVVDPSPGPGRKPVAIEVGDGAAYLVGPDNGLFAPAVSLVGGATRAVVLDSPEYHLPAPASVFAARDIFAPVAAHLCNGVELDHLGTAIDPALLMPGMMAVSQANEDGSIAAEVLWIDRFGNAQLNVDPAEIASWPEFIQVEGGRMTRTAERVEWASDLGTGSVGLVVDAYGLLALAVDRGSAAFDLSLSEGDAVTLRPADGPGRIASPVVLQTKPSRENPGPETTITSMEER